MENCENIYKSICRLCLNYSDSKKMISLIDKNSQTGLTAYAKAVSTFARINLSKQDCFPSNMCLKCLYLLKHAIHFKLVTESSDNCLKKIKNSLGNDSDNLKEKIMEFTMLKFYFPTECFRTLGKYSESKNNLKERINGSHIIENNKVVKENQHTSENSIDDNVFETQCPESDAEHNILHNKVKLLDKIENLIGSNKCKSSNSIQKMFTRKKKGAKRKCLESKEQYKSTLKLKRMQKKNLVCNVCNRVLANQMTYDHHMQRHTGCRYICEHCGKGFPVLNELQIHQVTKHGTGPYLQCSSCSFKAPRKFDLIEHERIHSGERPYFCDKCGLTFRRRGIWRKHLIYHSEKKIQCPQCPRKFFQRSEMLAHANNIHDRLYVYTCSKCDATYTKTETVRRHMTERHGIPRDMQGKIIRVNKGARYQEQ